MQIDWLKDLKFEEFPEAYQEMISQIGMENTVKLIRHFNGQQFYFGGLKKLIEKKKREYILKNFNGSNHKELARTAGFSEIWVYELLRKTGKER